MIDVAGDLKVLDQAKLFPCVDELTGEPLKFSCANFTLDANATVNANDRGWHWFSKATKDSRCRYVHPSRDLCTFAPSCGMDNVSPRGGAGHGNLGGGVSAGASWGQPYGFAFAPFLAGSHGGGDSGFTKNYASGRALRGGGAFWVRAKGVATVNGLITAKPSHQDENAAPSGGGVWIAANEFSAGAGAKIVATGGTARVGPSGAGGRISVAVGLSDEQLDSLAGGERPEGLDYFETLSAIETDVRGAETSSDATIAGTATFVTTADESKVTATVRSAIPLAVTGVDPNYGDWQVPGDEATVFSAPEYGFDPENGSFRYPCLGYVISNATTEVASGTENSVSFTPSAEDFTVTWLWGEREFGVTLEKPEGGAVRANGTLLDGESAAVWTREGGTCVLEAVADEGWEFLHWLGEVPADDRMSPEISLVPSEQRVAKPVFRRIAAPTHYVWKGGTGNWTDESKWEPAGVPWADDEVTVSNGTLTIVSCVRAKSLSVSDTAKVKVSPTATSRLNDNTILVISEDLSVGGSARLDVGATDHDNSVHHRLDVGGDLTLSGSATLLLAGGSRDSVCTEKTGTSFLNVAGSFTVGDSAVYIPNANGRTGGVPVVTVGRTFAVAVGAKVDANKRGFGPVDSVSPSSGLGRFGTTGAGHGGRGQSGSSDTQGVGGDVYDYLYAPVWPGQENRDGGVPHVRGGGAVRVKAHKICVDGTITAVGGTNQGASSGGSIWLFADKVSFGSEAELSVQGSSPEAENPTWGSSGGGRISICSHLNDEQYAALLENGNLLPDKVADVTEKLLSEHPSFADAVRPGDRALMAEACYGTFVVLDGARSGLVISIR